AILHPERRRAVGADATGGAGYDDVAGHELGEGRAVGDQGGDIEHEVRDGGGLHLDAVEAGRNRLLADIWDFVRRYHPRPERAGADEILARRELRGVALPVADAAVIVAGIARDMRQRRLARNAAA